MGRGMDLGCRPRSVAPDQSVPNVRRSMFKVRCLGAGSAAVTLLLACRPGLLWGQLEILRDEPPPSAFSGESRKLRVLFHNPTAQALDSNLRTRLYQASSATVMPAGPVQPWKRLTILAHQTVAENFTMNFPAVRAETRFQVHWLDDRDQMLGLTEVQVHPDDLLKGLAARAGGEAVGVLDPDNLLKPILTRLKVAFHDLESGAGFDGFHGRLAIVGPFAAERSAPAGLGERIKANAKEPGVWVWIQPPGPRGAGTFPPVYVVPCGLASVVVVHPDLMADLAHSPRAQLDLLRCIDWAQHPELVRLPGGNRGEIQP